MASGTWDISSMIKWQFREQWIRYKSETCVKRKLEKQKRGHRKNIDVVASEKNGEKFLGGCWGF
ncbi:hypothetical protein GALMADRAFT_244086 [Galerina marginata CBS 339.88]|uniref:Uncharacterized protein n=1 Tax=Galerina marginata (strain CBS 339.88) TaxID=685588 RepID=A0A067TFE5_GALM3|nr:hypothetical protein GALMADRAFT_244086 [Galerina marginata CBS 339.88]